MDEKSDRINIAQIEFCLDYSGFSYKIVDIQ